MRRKIIIGLILWALVFAYWTTGRMDEALAPWGFNWNDCYQVLGSYHC